MRVVHKGRPVVVRPPEVQSPRDAPSQTQEVCRRKARLATARPAHHDSVAPKRACKLCMLWPPRAAALSASSRRATRLTVDPSPTRSCSADDYTYPWLWGSWREEARVLVPRQAFLSGRLDLNRLLSSAPPELIAHLQRTIAQQARVFQFSEVDDEGGQLHALIVGALREARRLELERGAPQYTQWECTLARQCS
eukprot:6851778-Prymnesium_polylepis.1